jgi:hypothetical protein
VLPLPHISAQPQIGLMLGGSVNYAYRRAGQEFNSAYVQAWSQVSTRLVQDHNLSARLRDLMRRNELLQFGAMARRDPVFPYYGVDNHDNLAGTDLSGPTTGSTWTTTAGGSPTSTRCGSCTGRPRPRGTCATTPGCFITVDVIRARPAAAWPSRTRSASASSGAAWPASASPGTAATTTGTPARAASSTSPSTSPAEYTGSTSNWGRMHLSARNYMRLGTPELVLATRVTLDALIGAPPLMALGELGGLCPVDAYGGAFVGRGFVRRRFIGDFKALATAELRFTPLERKLGRHTGTIGFDPVRRGRARCPAGSATSTSTSIRAAGPGC